MLMIIKCNLLKPVNILCVRNVNTFLVAACKRNQPAMKKVGINQMDFTHTHTHTHTLILNSNRVALRLFQECFLYSF